MPPASSSVQLEYVREPDVSEVLDRELRELIGNSFPQPRCSFFFERRYAQEMPLHRHLLRDAAGRLVAHVAVHEKLLGVGSEELLVGGIAEVCVHESHRGQGLARRLLDRTHDDLRERGIEFAVLFGDAPVYAASGYLALSAEIRRFDPATQSFETGPSRVALYKPLTLRPWPDGSVDLRGPMF